MKIQEKLTKSISILIFFLIVSSLIRTYITYSFFGINIMGFVNLNTILLGYIANWRVIIIAVFFSSFLLILLYRPNFMLVSRGVSEKYPTTTILTISTLSIGSLCLYLAFNRELNSFKLSTIIASLVIISIILCFIPVIFSRQLRAIFTNESLFIYTPLYSFCVVIFFTSMASGVYDILELATGTSRYNGSTFQVENKKYVVNDTLIYLGQIDNTYFLHDTQNQETHILSQGELKHVSIKIKSYL